MALHIGKTRSSQYKSQATAGAIGTGGSIAMMGASWWGGGNGSNSPFSKSSNAKISKWMDTP